LPSRCSFSHGTPLIRAPELGHNIGAGAPSRTTSRLFLLIENSTKGKLSLPQALASVARSALGRRGSTTIGFVTAGISGTPSKPGESAPPASIIGLRPSALVTQSSPHSLSCLPFWRDGQSSVPPCSEPALKRPHIFVPALLKFPRQTGARAFVGSSAVRHYRSVLGDSGKVFFELVRRYSDRFW
jgi:hypothetical protein